MQIIGHHKERKALERLLTKEGRPQALLFSGPESIGKKLVALEFAKHLVGQKDFIPSSDQSVPLDVMLLAPIKVVKRGVVKKKMMGVESVREALQFLKKSPQGGRFRVLLIDDADFLSDQAQNVLLKFVEEPDETALLIFITHERQKLLTTITSRLQEVRFTFVPEEVLVQEIEKFQITVSSEIPGFFFSLGRPGILLEADKTPEHFRKKKEQLKKLFLISTLSLKERFDLAQELSQNVPNTTVLFEWFLPGLYAKLRGVTEREQILKHYTILEGVERALRDLKKKNAQSRLIIEQLFLSLP